MIARVGVLRPEPGNAATAARVRAAGMEPVSIALFRAVALPWQAPGPADYDALVLTSANAARLAGPGLAKLATLPVRVVGEATAAAARAAGLTVASVGDGGVAAMPAAGRLLHLAGRDHVALPGADTIIVYDSVAIAADVTALAGTVALLHSARAARRLLELSPDRATIRLVAISPAVAVAAGDGWRSVDVAPTPDDRAMVTLARALTD